MLAIFLGFEVISKVPTLLHTPLMSGTNAIHGIVIVGAILVAGLDHRDRLMSVSGSIAIGPATANVVGGFVVTDRMLEMFKQKRGEETRGLDSRLPPLPLLVTLVTFILALRFPSIPATAPRGNQIGAAGMLVAIIVTLLQQRRQQRLGDHRRQIDRRRVRVVAARKVHMTAMPQMVALFNGVGGGAAALVSLAEFHLPGPDPGTPRSRPRDRDGSRRSSGPSPSPAR